MTLISSHNGEHETGRCDAKCYNATGGKCDCICGGKNHGVGKQQAIDNVREYVEEWVEKWKKENPEDRVKLNEIVKQLNIF